MHLRPLAALLARPTFSGLWSGNCLSGAYVLREDMFIGGHVLQECMCSGWHILQTDVS